jgi:hypothetical protein
MAKLYPQPRQHTGRADLAFEVVVELQARERD